MRYRIDAIVSMATGYLSIRAQRGEARRRHTPAGDFVSKDWRGRMPMLQEMFQPQFEFERRAVGRTTINRGVLMFFEGQKTGVQSCCVRDVTNHGAGIRFTGLTILPSEFGISFDGFRTMRRCRLIWRDGDFVGAAFEN